MFSLLATGVLRFPEALPVLKERRARLPQLLCYQAGEKELGANTNVRHTW